MTKYCINYVQVVCPACNKLYEQIAVRDELGEDCEAREHARQVKAYYLESPQQCDCGSVVVVREVYPK